MNRIDRISAILIQLQSHSLVKAQQISERFNISIRTVYRDIRTLEEAGIPYHRKSRYWLFTCRRIQIISSNVYSKRGFVLFDCREIST